jgi:hypothetical protein
MRLAALTLVGSLAIGSLASAGIAGSANAAPAVPNLPQSSNLIQVSGGCGPYAHRDGWGYCVQNYYRAPVWYGGYYGPSYYHGYYPRSHHRVYW